LIHSDENKSQSELAKMMGKTMEMNGMGRCKYERQRSYKTRKAYENDDDKIQVHGGWVYAITDMKKLAMLQMQVSSR